MLTLPLELVSEILRAVLNLGEVHTGDAPINSKPLWYLVSSLSLTCKSYRGLVFEAWFRHFYTENPKDTIELTKHIPQAKKTWVKQLHCVNPGPSDPRYEMSWDLEGYNQLEFVRLDWLPSRIPHQGNSLEDSDYLPFVNTPHTITSFDFRSIRWPYPTAYLFIQRCFPSIKKLVLHQQKIWCGLCFTVNRVSFAAPIPHRLICENGRGLPLHYAKALKSLQFLEHISINTVASELGFTSINQAQNEFLWAGECDWCMRLFFTDYSFLDAYVSNKKRGVVQLANGTDHEWPRPPRLQFVEWIFTPVTASDEESDDDISEVEYIDTDQEVEGADYEDPGEDDL